MTDVLCGPESIAHWPWDHRAEPKNAASVKIKLVKPSAMVALHT